MRFYMPKLYFCEQTFDLICILGRVFNIRILHRALCKCALQWSLQLEIARTNSKRGFFYFFLQFFVKTLHSNLTYTKLLMVFPSEYPLTVKNDFLLWCHITLSVKRLQQFQPLFRQHCIVHKIFMVHIRLEKENRNKHIYLSVQLQWLRCGRVIHPSENISK